MVGLGTVNLDITITRPQHRDSLGRFDTYARNPILAKDEKRIFNELIQNIHTRELKRQGYRSSPPYHTYPTETFGDLEKKAYAKKKGKNMLVIGSKSQHASILETGRDPVQAATGKGLAFRGYYPSKSIMMAILRNKSISELPKKFKGEKYVEQRKNRLASNKQTNEMITEEIQVAYGAKGKPHLQQQFAVQSSRGGYKGLTEIRIKSRSAKYYQSPDRLAVRAGIDPSGRTKYRDNKGKIYKYGIFTVLTKRVKAVKPQGVFIKTALWAKSEIVERVRGRIGRIGKTTGKVI